MNATKETTSQAYVPNNKTRPRGSSIGDKIDAALNVIKNVDVALNVIKNVDATPIVIKNVDTTCKTQTINKIVIGEKKHDDAGSKVMNLHNLPGHNDRHTTLAGAFTKSLNEMAEDTKTKKNGKSQFFNVKSQK